MTVSVSLAITLGAGLHVDAGAQKVTSRWLAAWGKTEVFVATATPWDLTRARAWRHEAPWAVRFAVGHQARYGLRLERTSQVPYGELRFHRIAQLGRYDDCRPLRGQHRLVYGEVPMTLQRMALSYDDCRSLSGQHRLSYGDVPQVLARHRLSYSEVLQTRARHALLYAALAPCQQSMRACYSLTQPLATRHALDYAVTTVTPLATRLLTGWSLLEDGRLQAVANTPELTWAGRPVRIVQATLSCDEDSPVWIAQVEIAELGDFAGIGIGDPITLTLGLETFVLVVDGKTLSRESVADQRCVLSAVSPVALLDAPFAGTIRYYQPAAVAAGAAVEALIGAVDWQLPPWTIPAGRLLLEGVTPLAAARNIVAAIGGVLESRPDGSLVCRRRHPVSLPAYGQAPVAHSLFDADVLSARAQIAPSRGFNRVTLANEDGAAGVSSDRIEFVADPDDASRGTVRALLGTPRPVVLAHTGHAATVIAAVGEVVRSEVETVEFIEGRAGTRYPVAAIVNAVWQHTDLGAVTPDGQTLIAAVVGYSLGVVSYTTTAREWRVALALAEEVQFVLVDL